MFSDSVLYTIGTALGRAHDNGVDVEVLVEGQWIAGRVVAVDGHGVVLAAPPAPEVGTGEHSVVKMTCIAAVRLFGAAPDQGQARSHGQGQAQGHTPIAQPAQQPAGARAMPGAASA